MSRAILFRVDAAAAIGGGHVSRCCALAVALQQQGFTPCFVSAAVIETDTEPQPGTGVSMLPEQMQGTVLNVTAASTDDLLATEAIIERLKPACVVVDGYHFDGNYLQHLAQSAPLVVIDDENNRGPLSASVVINPTSGAIASEYTETAPGADLLLGSDYALLSPDFAAVTQQDFQGKDRLLICFGASDVRQRTFPVVRLLGKALGAQAPVDVVCGKLCQQVEEVRQVCEELGYRFYHNADNMPQLMQRAAMAIAAPGTLLYELACAGVPAVFVVAANNQQQSATYHQQQGWCVVLDTHATARAVVSAAVALWSDPHKRQSMSTLARQQVDGQGVARVASFLRQKFLPAPVAAAGEQPHG